MYRDLGAALRMARETEARLSVAQARIVLLPARIRILRALADRRSTVTELSKRTRIAKSTALKHLRVLEKHGLVVRREEDRLWIYYDLTRAGRAVGRLDPLRIVVLMSAIVAAGFMIGAIVLWREGKQMQGEDLWGVPPVGGEPVEPAARALALTLGVGGFVLFAGAASLWLWSRRRLAPDGEEPTDRSSSP